MKNIIIAVLAVFLLASIGANFFLFFRYSTSRPLLRTATGQQITRKEFQEQLDYEYGKPILNKLTYRKLIMDAAKKANVLPTEKDVDQRIADIERRTPAVLESAKRDSTKMGEMRKDVMTDLAFENYRIKDVKMTDAQIAEFYSRNKAGFSVPTQVQTTLVVATNSVDAEAAKQLLADGTKPEIIARQPRLAVVGVNNFQIKPSQIPPELGAKINATVFKMKQGDIIAIPAGTDFLIIKKNSESLGGVPSLEAVKPLVTRLAKLTKAPAPDTALMKLFKEAGVTFEVEKYGGYFSDVQSRIIQESKVAAAKPSKAATAATVPAP